MRALSKVLTGSMIAAAALAVSACGPKTTTTDNTTVTDLNATEGTDTMTDNMGAVDTATDNGMMANDTTMTTDKAGNAQLFEGIHSTCRDLARFGVLMLDDGRFGGRQIVSRRWVEAATGRSSTALNAGLSSASPSIVVCGRGYSSRSSASEPSSR